MNCKYSIIIPSRNGGKYLRACIESIVSQGYDDYELIISDDHSTDSAKDILSEYASHPNITLLEPAEELSMTEHWEWALSHANGDWQIFVGQDDGLQPYFFKHADKLTKIAQNKKLRTIMSSRAYYFWQGCEPIYGDVALNYKATNKIKIHNSTYETIKALLGIQYYFELPQMYTTALFHKSLLEEVRSKQNGRVLTCHPQDANLGAIAMSLEKQYLKSYIPLGWVGSSPKSAGMAISSQNGKFSKEDSDTIKELEKEYTQKIKKSKFQYNQLAGDFSFANHSLYLWQAFLETPTLRPQKINNILNAKVFKYLLFSSVQVKLWKQNRSKQGQFQNILEINNCSLTIVKMIAYVFMGLVLLYRSVRKIFWLSRKVLNRLPTPTVKIYFSRSKHQDLTLQNASEIVMEHMEKIV